MAEQSDLEKRVLLVQENVEIIKDRYVQELEDTIVDAIKSAILKKEFSTEEELLNRVNLFVGGSRWICDPFYAKLVCLVSANAHDRYLDDLTSTGVPWSTMATVLMTADIIDLLDLAGVDIDNPGNLPVEEDDDEEIRPGAELGGSW